MVVLKIGCRATFRTATTVSLPYSLSNFSGDMSRVSSCYPSKLGLIRHCDGRAEDRVRNRIGLVEKELAGCFAFDLHLHPAGRSAVRNDFSIAQCLRFLAA